MAKKVELRAGASLSYEEAIKAMKAMKGSMSIIGEKEISELCMVGRIRTGIPTIDFMGGGGITEGRITIFAGNPSSAKTTTTLQIVGAMIEHFKSKGEMKFILYFDVEGAFDTAYAKALGIDLNYLIIKRTKVIEEAFKEADDLISMGIIGGMVIDSLDGMIARKVEDNAYGNTMGSQSGALAMHLPNLYGKIIDFNVTTIFIKQARVKMDAYGAKGEVITFNGGKALRHFTDSIFIMKRLSNRNLSYCPVQCKAEKTRSARMGLILDLPLGDCGIDRYRDLVNLAVANGFIIVGGGGWMSYGDIREQGLDKFLIRIKNDSELYVKLKEEVYTNIVNSLTIIGQSNTEGEEIITDLDGDDN